MSRGTWTLLIIPLAVVGVAQQPTSRATLAHSAPTYVASSRVVVTPHVDAETAVDRVELWISRDGRRSWSLASTTDDARRVEFEAPSDGRYDLFLRLMNAAGASSEPPQTGATPVASVVVDTIPPLLQLHEAVAATDDSGADVIRLRLSVFDENLGPAGVRIFHRTAGDSRWRDGGTVEPVEGRAEWMLPPDHPAAVDLRVIVCDRAGNSAGDERRDIRVMEQRPLATTRPHREPAELPEAPPVPARVSLSQAPHAPPRPAAQLRTPEPPESDVRLHTRATFAADRDIVSLAPHAAARSDAPASSPSAPSNYARVERLRALAARHVSLGEHALAAARLNEALGAAPGDLDTLVQYAGVLTASGDLASAASRYEEARTVAPQDPRVLDGLAAVAAARGEFAAAREHLQKLIEVTPQAGRAWLHYGDVEHRLGRSNEALAAWRRALESAGDADVRGSAQRRLKLLGPERVP